MKRFGDLERLARLETILLGKWGELDGCIPGVLRVLEERRAPLCWHKHGSFAEHLKGTAMTLTLWGAPEAVVRCALIHSAYSNSYVNLSLFSATQDRRDCLVGGGGE